jgi:hypothetical protein
MSGIPGDLASPMGAGHPLKGRVDAHIAGRRQAQQRIIRDASEISKAERVGLSIVSAVIRELRQRA